MKPYRYTDQELGEMSFNDMKNIIRSMEYFTTGQPYWIPVSERLPEESGEFLVTRYSFMFKFHDVEILWYTDEIGFHFYDSEYGDVPIDGVTAWAMLPEPYRETLESQNNSEKKGNERCM